MLIRYLSDCSWTRTQNHLVRKRTLNHLAKHTVLSDIAELVPAAYFGCTILVILDFFGSPSLDKLMALMPVFSSRKARPGFLCLRTAFL